MSLDSMTLSWVERFYYKGVGLQLPSRFPKPEKQYQVEFRRNMLQPVQQMLGKDYSVELVPQFMQEYQKLGKITSFHLLPLLTVSSSSDKTWQEQLKDSYEKLIKDAEVWMCLAKGGWLFRAYVRNGKAIGKFPVDVHPIMHGDEFPKGSDPSSYITDLLTKNPLTFTDTECEYIRRIFAADGSYSEESISVEMEVYDHGTFQVKRVSPLEKEFPPKEYIDVLTLLPTSNPYDSIHELAWNVVGTQKEKYPVAYAYLENIFTKAEDASDCEDNVERAEHLGELLQRYVDSDALRSYWTVKDVIDYYYDRISYPTTHDPSDTELSNDNDLYYAGVLQEVMNYLQDSPILYDWKLRDVRHLLETGDDPVEKEFTSVQELLDSGVKLSKECLSEIATNGAQHYERLGFDSHTSAILAKGTKNEIESAFAKEPSVEEFLLSKGYTKEQIAALEGVQEVSAKTFLRGAGIPDNKIDDILTAQNPTYEIALYHLDTEGRWNTSDAKNFLNGSPVYDNTDPDVLKDVLTKQCPWYTPNDINTIMAGKAMCQLEKSRVGRWLQEVNPAYTDAIVSDILSGKATNQLNSSTVWEWLHAEYPEYSADFLNQLMMGTLPPLEVLPISDFWTLMASQVIDDNVRAQLISPEYIMRCAYIPNALKQEIVDAVTKKVELAGTGFVAYYLSNVGFDSKTIQGIMAGSLPMSDTVQVEELPAAPRDPFEDVIRSTDVNKKLVLVRQILKDLWNLTEENAYRLSMGQSYDTVEDIIKSGDKKKIEDAARLFTAKVLNVPAEEVSFNQKQEAPISDNVSLQIGYYLLSSMKAKLLEIDKLPTPKALAIRKGFIPLFQSLVPVFAAKDDPVALKSSLERAVTNEALNAEAAALISDAIDFAGKVIPASS